MSRSLQSGKSRKKESIPAIREPNDYANPTLVEEKARRLAAIPFELSPDPLPEGVKVRAKHLAQELRDAEARGIRPYMKMELQSTLLYRSLPEPWPTPENERDSDDDDYPLFDTEEEYFKWKRERDERRARKRAQHAKEQQIFSVHHNEVAKDSSAKYHRPKIYETPQTPKPKVSRKRPARKSEFDRVAEEFATGNMTHTVRAYIFSSWVIL
jgi:hypothetical protein